MGFDLSYALSRADGLSAEEVDAVATHLLRWRGRIINYDWHMPREVGTAPGGVIAWGSLRPTRGKSNVSDQGGYLPDVVANLHAAMAEMRELIGGAALAFGDDFGAFTWTERGFDYDRDAAHPALPIHDVEGTWVSLATTRAIPDGAAAKQAAKASGATRPKTAVAAREALASLDRDGLIKRVMSPSPHLGDRERTAAVELLGVDSDPATMAVLVSRLRNDGYSRMWTTPTLHALAAGPRRCSWATALLAFDRCWAGALELLLATVTGDALPHLARLPRGHRWNTLVALSLDALDSETAREIRRQRAETITGDGALRLGIVDAVLTARRMMGGDLRAAVQHIADALEGLASAGGDRDAWLAHDGNAASKALGLLAGKRVKPSTVVRGLDALLSFSMTSWDPSSLSEPQRLELRQLEEAWLEQTGITIS